MDEPIIPSAASIFSAFATEHVSEARDKEGGDETESIELGNQCFSEDDFIGAVKHYRRANEQGGESPEGLLRLASALEAADQPEEAHALYLQSYELEPGFEAAFAAAQTARTLAEGAEAEEWFQRAIQHKPDSAFARYSFARFHREGGQRHRAKEEALKAAEIAESEPDYWMEAGELCLDDSDPQQAELCYRKVLEFAPTNREGMLHLALAQWQLNKRGEATASVRIAIELDDDPKIASGLLAHMLRMQGFEEDAREESQRASGLSPYDQGNLDRMLIRLGVLA